METLAFIVGLLLLWGVGDVVSGLISDIRKAREKKDPFITKS